MCLISKRISITMYPIRRSKSENYLDRMCDDDVRPLLNNSDTELGDAVRCLIYEKAYQGILDSLSDESVELLKLLREMCDDISRKHSSTFNQLFDKIDVKNVSGYHLLKNLIQSTMVKKSNTGIKLALISLCSSVSRRSARENNEAMTNNNITRLANVLAYGTGREPGDIRNYISRSKSKRLKFAGVMGVAVAVFGLVMVSASVMK